GKNIIWNHHLSVPYHSMDEVDDLHFQPEKGGGNLIVEGDNLIALKALLPQYSGKVDCIYIDPPYNTGNEGWVYNDKVNSPLIKDWLGKEVNSDDLTKHDKWLCMMTPRLKLLKELLNDNGVIFISIDDNEQHHLKSIMDDVFGSENFVSIFPWRKRTAKSDVPFGISQDFEWIMCYAQNDFLAGVISQRNYKYSEDFGDNGWRLTDLTTQRNEKERPNSAFTLVDPKTKKEYPHNPKRVWAITKDTFKEYYDKGKIIFPNDYDFLKISIPSYRVFESEDRQKATEKYGTENILKAVSTMLPKEVGMTQDGNKEMVKLFGSKLFSFPKPVGLIQYLISVLNNKDALILDSFAGSGTTMHAVMQLNKEDGGNRQCIMVQMPENSESEPDKNVCRDITRERVKRAIEKYGFNTGFKYLRVGSPIDPETMLDGDLPTYQQFAEYVYYLATGGHLADKSKVDAAQHFVGMEGGRAVYLIYEQDMDQLTRLALTLQIAEAIIKHSPGKRRVIFAPSCFLDEEYMAAMQIEFVSVPYNLFERKADV
ncbi:MAG: site-specific DNA-methyltransferase, partial [Bacteroidota bacterium]